MLSELLGNCQDYEEESFNEFTSRYHGFGKEIYKTLQNKIPDIFEKLKFYRATGSTEKCVGDFPYIEDSYAIYDDQIATFQIQLDPLSEVAIIFNYEITFETGYWSLNPNEDILNFIKTNFIKY